LATIVGLGMAMLYPNLSAAVADIAPPNWRASAIGIYRFRCDLGYGIGALGLGAAAALGGQLESAFWFVAIAMLVSGAVLHRCGEETHPRLNPATRLFLCATGEGFRITECGAEGSSPARRSSATAASR
jgi:MFS family permease